MLTISQPKTTHFCRLLAELGKHLNVEIQQPQSVARWTDGVNISTLRVNVKPRSPSADQTIFFKESFGDGIVTKIRSIGKAH